MAGPDELIVTEEGVLSPEELALRQQAGTAAAVVGEDVLLGEEAGRLREETASSPLLTGLERGVSAATFGLTDVLAGEEEREERRRRAEADPTAAAVGGVAGAVVPALLSGGTGALSTLARLTPAGRLANITAKVAARGGARRIIGSSAAEGVIAAVGEEFARQSIQEDPDFSAEALVSTALRGAAFGAAGGGIGALLSRGAGKVARRIDAADAAEEAARVASIAKKAKKPTADPVGLFPTSSARTNFKRVASKRVADTSADRARDLGVAIDNQVARRVADDLDGILARGPSTLGDDAADLVTRARALSTEHEAAAKKASDWFSRYSDDVGLPGAKKRLTKPVSSEVEDAGIDALQELERTARAYDDVAEELAARAGLSRVPVSPPQTELGAGLSSRMGAKVSGAREVATTVLGAGEVATSLGAPGVPSARDIPVIGGLVSGYLQLKAASRLAGKMPGNWFRASRVTETAERVVSVRDKLARSARSAANAGLKRVARSQVPRITGAQVTAAVDQLQRDRGQAGAVAREYADSGAEVSASLASAMVRASDHLIATAPKPPVTGAQVSGEWHPDPTDIYQWQARKTALAHPEDTLRAVVEDPGAPAVAFESVRLVYPALYEQYRDGLSQEMGALANNYDDVRLTAIGQAFGLPLTAANLHDYGEPILAPGTGMAPDEARLRFATPTQTTVSPLATLEQTDEQRRRA